MKRKDRMKKDACRVTALALSGMLIAGSVTPVYAAQENTPKDENVYVNLNQDGSVDGIYVVNAYRLDADTQIVDYGNYESVKNLTSDAQIQSERGTVTVDAQAGEFFYQGNLRSGEIPWEISIRYTLDGKEVSAEELAGKNGRLKISIHVGQNTKADAEFFENYLLQVTLTMDMERCSGLEAPGATVANVGTDKQLVYSILAGSEKDITVTADVLDFEMDAIQIQGLPMNLDVDRERFSLDELHEKAGEISDAADEFSDGAQDLSGGADALKEGAEGLQSGAKSLKEGIESYADGARSLGDGIDTLQDGSNDLADGAQELVDGITSLQDGANQLRDGYSGENGAASGARKLADGVKELKAGSHQLSEGVSALVDRIAGIGEDSSGSLNAKAQEAVAGAERINGMLGMLGIRIDTGDASEPWPSRLETISGSLEDAMLRLVSLAGSLSGEPDGSEEEVPSEEEPEETLPEEETLSEEEMPEEETLPEEAPSEEETPSEESRPSEETPSEEETSTEENGPSEEVSSEEETPSEESRPSEEASSEEETPSEESRPSEEATSEGGASTEENGPSEETTSEGGTASEDKPSAEENDPEAAPSDEKPAAEIPLPEAALTEENSLPAEKEAPEKAGASAEEEEAPAPGKAEGKEASFEKGTASAAQTVSAAYRPWKIGKQEQRRMLRNVGLKQDEREGRLQSLSADRGNGGMGALDIGSVVSGLIELKSGVDQLIGAYGVAKQLSASLGSEETQAQLAQLKEGAAALDAGIGELESGVSALADGIGQLADGTGQLADGVSELADGGNALADGTKELADGVSDLADGVDVLTDASDALRDGSAQLADGTEELADGAGDLVDGVADLKEGTDEFKSKTGDIDTEIDEEVDSVVDDLSGSDFEQISFVSDKNTNVELVQFVMQTEGIRIPEEVKLPAAEEPMSLWQRLLALFGLA